MLLQIHDELVFEIPTGSSAAFVPLLRSEMESAFDLRVPLKVDIAIGPNWLDLEDI